MTPTTLLPDTRCCARCGALTTDTVSVVVSAPGVALDGDSLCPTCAADEGERAMERAVDRAGAL